MTVCAPAAKAARGRGAATRAAGRAVTPGGGGITAGGVPEAGPPAAGTARREPVRGR